MATAYVTLKGGRGYVKVASFDSVTYSDQLLASGYYRNTGWVPNQEQIAANVTVGLSTVALTSVQVPATGTAAVPDEQAHTAPRSLTWSETKISFLLGARVVAEFYWKYIKGISNQPPSATT